MVADSLARAGVEVILGALVERLERGRDFAPDPFVYGVKLQRDEPVLNLIAAADLRRPFVEYPGHDLTAVRQEDRSQEGTRLEPVIGMSVDALVKLGGGDQGQRAILVRSRRAVGVAERAAGAAIAPDIAGKRAAGIREVAAAAAGAGAVTVEQIAIGVVAVVRRVVLPGRDHGAELETLPDRRFVPDRMVHAPIELGAVVAAGIAPQRIVIGHRVGERV